MASQGDLWLEDKGKGKEARSPPEAKGLEVASKAKDATLQAKDIDPKAKDVAAKAKDVVAKAKDTNPKAAVLPTFQLSSKGDPSPAKT